MPTHDGTGPSGRGPMTGRGNGFCIVRLDANESLAGNADGVDEKMNESINKGAYTPGNTEGADAKKEANKMPRGNGTGPEGMGPMTGRGLGYCAGYALPGYASGMPGQGFGRGVGYGAGRGGRGGGRGLGWRQAGLGRRFAPDLGFAPYTAPSKEQELELLRSQAGGFQSALDDVKQRIKALESADVDTAE